MRAARRKLTEVGCYYHLMNRVAGDKTSLPFDDVDREFGMKLVMRLSRYYLLEFVSMCWMGNHFHIVVYAPCEAELPSLAEIAARHNAYYGQDSGKAVDPRNKTSCAEIGRRMIDISRFMKDFQQRFVHRFNRLYNRRGHLWADRFKSAIIEGREALWTAVKYVELNPVRAGLCADPANYRHSAWGWAKGSGRHPFEVDFCRHMRRSLGDEGAELDDSEIISMFAGELARTIAAESGAASGEIESAVEKAKRGESMPVRFLRRTRHLTDGGILGSKAFVREVAAKFQDDSPSRWKRFSRGSLDNGSALYCLKRLRKIT